MRSQDLPNLLCLGLKQLSAAASLQISTNCGDRMATIWILLAARVAIWFKLTLNLFQKPQGHRPQLHHMYNPRSPYDCCTVISGQLMISPWFGICRKVCGCDSVCLLLF